MPTTIKRVDNIIYSTSLFTSLFACDLSACRGSCCVKGDAGAPLHPSELPKLPAYYELPELSAEHRRILSQNAYTTDINGTHRTPLANNSACAYSFLENGVYKCGIERYSKDYDTDYQKPISCHLYPIRAHYRSSLWYLNYHTWSICSAACDNGHRLGLPVFRFCADALKRQFGELFYLRLEEKYVQSQEYIMT